MAISAILESETGNLTDVRITHTKESANAPIAVFDNSIIYKMHEKEVLLKSQEDKGLINETCYFTIYGFASKEDFLLGELGFEIALAQ